MKNKSLSKLTAIVLLITMLTLIVLASTYAKYTSSFTGTGTATAANWVVSISGDATTYAQTFTLTASDKVYPGGSGTLGTITVKNESNTVKAKIMSVQVSNIQVDGVANPITNFSIANPDVSSQTAINPAGTASVPVNYTWAYSTTDETQYANKPITFTVTVVVDQVQ